MDTFISSNPATGEPLGTFPVMNAAEVDCAAMTADEALLSWRALSVSDRCARLQQLRAAMAGAADSLATTVSREIGKPLQEAYAADLMSTLTALDWLIRQAPRRLRPTGVPGARGAIRSPEPYGLVGVIGTWNYPIFLDLTSVAWALAAGNVVLWKPSELATVTATALHAHCAAAELPIFLLTGDATTGRALCRAGCDKIAFTGGVATGRAILAELAGTGTPSVMELSGNDAMIVCADADLGLAVRSAVWGRCCNAGQSCIAPQRFYVAEAVYDRFLQECHHLIETLRPGVDYGPLRTEGLRRNVQKLVWEAVESGARLRSGGHALAELPGYHYAPTLLADCDDDMRVMAQDFFGPVLAVCPVHNEEEAIRRTNASEMGLGASVWTRDRRRGREIATALRVGVATVNVDTLLIAGDARLPFGGLRASGFGKQRGTAGLEEFVQWKVTAVRGTGGARRHLFPYREATLPILRGMIALRAARGPHAKIQALRQLIRAVGSGQ
jgi:acyl-CoA reductase-like NAD-dependent aldehyde dehydrogenase